jgi:hypothetical protein
MSHYGNNNQTLLKGLKDKNDEKDICIPVAAETSNQLML